MQTLKKVQTILEKTRPFLGSLMRAVPRDLLRAGKAAVSGAVHVCQKPHSRQWECKVLGKCD